MDREHDMDVDEETIFEMNACTTERAFAVAKHHNFDRPTQEQMEAISTLAIDKASCMCLLPTGSGKTFIIEVAGELLQEHYEGKGFLVVLCPNTSLCHNHAVSLGRHEPMVIVKGTWTEEMLQERLALGKGTIITTLQMANYGLSNNDSVHSKFFKTIFANAALVAVDEVHSLLRWSTDEHGDVFKPELAVSLANAIRNARTPANLSRRRPPVLFCSGTLVKSHCRGFLRSAGLTLWCEQQLDSVHEL